MQIHFLVLTVNLYQKNNFLLHCILHRRMRMDIIFCSKFKSKDNYWNATGVPVPHKNERRDCVECRNKKIRNCETQQKIICDCPHCTVGCNNIFILVLLIVIWEYFIVSLNTWIKLDLKGGGDHRRTALGAGAIGPPYYNKTCLLQCCHEYSDYSNIRIIEPE